MHTNHRRKHKVRAKHHGKRRWPHHFIYSCADHRRESWQRRRARVRDLIRRFKFDEIPRCYRRDIYWKYW